MRDYVTPAALRALGLDPSAEIRLAEPLSVTGLIALMSEAPAQRTFLAATGPDSVHADNLHTYRFRISQMTVLRGSDRLVADGVRGFTETETLSVTGLLITGQLISSGAGITEDPEPLAVQMDFVGYLECSEGEQDTEPLARVLRLQFPQANDYTSVAALLGYTPEEQQARWTAMGFLPGRISGLCPLGEQEWLIIPELMQEAGLGTVDRLPVMPKVLTTDDVRHAVLGERYSVELRFSSLVRVDGKVTGYRFDGEIIGAQPGSDPDQSVPPLKHPTPVRGFIEPAADNKPLVFWIQLTDRPQPTAAATITETRLATQLLAA